MSWLIVDYEEVNNYKWDVLDKIYAGIKKETFASAEYKLFLKRISIG